MPEQIPFTVTFPDGHKQTFTGPSTLSDAEVWTRAQQERGFEEGRIPTTWLGGASKALGEDRSTTGALLTGAGLATGGVAPAASAAIVAGAPLAARGIEYATRKMTGQQPAAPGAADLATDAAEGLATAYGPEVIAKGARGFADLAPTARGHGFWPFAIKAGGKATEAVMDSPVGKGLEAATPESVGRTLGEISDKAKALSKDVIQAIDRTTSGISADDYALLRESIQKGMSPYAAAKIVSSGDSKAMTELLRLYSRYK